MNTCANCKFFEAPLEQCRRYPPTQPSFGIAVVRFPYTNDTIWCGEWQGKTEYVHAKPGRKPKASK